MQRQSNMFIQQLESTRALAVPAHLAASRSACSSLSLAHGIGFGGGGGIELNQFTKNTARERHPLPMFIIWLADDI